MIDKNDKLLLAEAKRMKKRADSPEDGKHKHLIWLRHNKKKVGIIVSAALFISVMIILIVFLLYGLKSPASSADTRFNIVEIQRGSSAEIFSLEGALLRNVLIERTAGSRGSRKVRRFIVKMLKDHGWDVKLDTFKSKTVVGDIEFNNIIGSLQGTDEKDNSFVVIGAHYDSKLFPGKRFLGAVDAAASVAILIDLARYLADTLPRVINHYSVRIVFFDGEEAFGKWDYNSALYGSRHLANLWKRTGELYNIRFLLLLDLIGHTNTSVLNIPHNDLSVYKKILDIQEEFRLSRVSSTFLKRLEMKKDNLYFKDKAYNYLIEDDHLPFRKENVRVVNLINVPFPPFHHTLADSPDKLNPNVMRDISTIIKKFIITSLLRDQSS